MIGLVRKIVAGPKNRTNWNGTQLDLTYITERLVAMAYPASGFQKTYRNSIDDVAEYFKEAHNNSFLVINISMRKYQYEKFSNNVNDYYWPDHQAPPLTTIFQICQDMKNFLSKTKDGVVAVHCNHGKGRTGTALISFMLYAGQFNSAQQALTFYNKRRFIVDTYGVDQPCQRRYLDYVQKMLKMNQIPQKLKAFKLVSVSQKGLDPSDYYLQISVTRTGQTKHTKLSTVSPLKNNTIPLINDIFIQLYEITWKGQKQVARINYNLFFLEYSQKAGAYIVEFSGQKIKVNGKHTKNFTLQIVFLEYCKCHSHPTKAFCECENDRERQQKEWQKMIEIINQSKKMDKKQTNMLVYGKQQENLDKIKQIQLELKNSFSSQEKNQKENNSQKIKSTISGEG